MARRRRPPSRSTQPPAGTADDAFAAGVLEATAWARSHSRLLIGGGTVLALLVVGTVYWVTQSSVQLDAAAQELEQLQQTIGFGDPATAVASVEGYLNRNQGTPYALEARMLLARVHLVGNENPLAAIEVLQEVAPDYGSALGFETTFLLAAAYEQAERWTESAELYEELWARSEYSFQQRQAGEGAGRAYLAGGDTLAAIQTYESLLAGLDSDDPDRPRYEMRLAELTAADG